MNIAEAGTHSLGHTSESGVSPLPISWNDWFHFDEELETCVFRSSGRIDQAEATVSAMMSAQEGQI